MGRNGLCHSDTHFRANRFGSGHSEEDRKKKSSNKPWAAISNSRALHVMADVGADTGGWHEEAQFKNNFHIKKNQDIEHLIDRIDETRR